MSSKAKKRAGNIVLTIGFGLMILPMVLIGVLIFCVEGVSKLTELSISSLGRGEANV